MPAYVIVETDVTNPERYEKYKAASSGAVAASGAAASSFAVTSSLFFRATGSRPA